ncbi:MAG TPA: AzlC family ABC transporter permease [Symbiobacteriaceae bacterium]
MATLETAVTRQPSSFLEGVRAAGPVMLGYLPIGFAFGVLARTAGLTVAEIGLMSVLVYAGSAQFIGAAMIGAGAPAPAIISTTFLVNLRHLLMSTALVPSLRQNRAWQNSLLAFGITDETFALNSALLRGQPASPAFVAGVHVSAQASWVLASVAGALVGQMAANTEALGLDFALPAMFIGLLVPQISGAERWKKVLSALVAAAVSIGILLLSPGSGWAIIGATVVGATVGVLLK